MWGRGLNQNMQDQIMNHEYGGRKVKTFHTLLLGGILAFG